MGTGATVHERFVHYGAALRLARECDDKTRFNYWIGNLGRAYSGAGCERRALGVLQASSMGGGRREGCLWCGALAEETRRVSG